MQQLTSAAGNRASVPADITRRSFFQFAAAGTVATLPVAAEAAVPSPLTDQQQLEACIAQLRDILQRLHPGADFITPYSLRRGEDGSYRFSMRADPSPVEFSGDGLYAVSEDGRVTTWWLEYCGCTPNGAGRMIPNPEGYRAMRWHNGTLEADRVRFLTSPYIIRKLAGDRA